MRLPGFWKRRRSAASDVEEELAASNFEPPDAFQNNADNDDSGAANGSSGYGLRPEAMMTDSASSHNAYPPQGNLPSARTSTSIDGITYRLWSPFFLRKIFLFALIVLFMVIGITLGVLFSQSSRHNGLSTAKESYYYLWTYGPTAVFTSIAALWAQVEYRSKQLMPWNALQRAPQRCETSLMLDYVDPMNIVSLFTSLRRSHIFVTVAIAGALIVQLMVVLSSGLFQAISVTVTTDDATLMAMEAFTGDYNDTITSRPASVIFGNLLYNLSYPLGTTQDYAYPLFDSSHSSVESLAAVVDVFSADLDCSTAKVDQTTQGFFGGLTDNPLIDDDGFTVTTDGDARNVWLAATDESNCTGLVAKVRNGHTWAYNGSFCQEQPDGADRNRLVFVSGSWNSDHTRTFTVDDLTTSTAGLIPGSLLAGWPSMTTSALLSTAVFSTVSTSPSKSGSGSTSGNDIQLDDPTVGSNDVFIQTASRTGPTYSNDVFIQTAARTASSSLTSATGSSGNDIQLDDPPSDLTIGIMDKPSAKPMSRSAKLLAMQTSTPIRPVVAAVLRSQI
ncbi:hypothetical protein MPH_00721 [Macrophomina phaseolina MS6]|uniref:Uncharacterized protein n=1 Tax=Macrophomina phaseolina (strain MS6) TaxID=1126212 RepID=K2SA82_MACPH|nr:hypothetical protein MPH_00721 [Macrophomina phaseolina MS6]